MIVAAIAELVLGIRTAFLRQLKARTAVGLLGLMTIGCYLLVASFRRLRGNVAAAACREYSSAAAVLPLTFPAITMWGANTDVGKTLVSAALVAAAARNSVSTLYVKPVQTGETRDANVVAAAAGGTELVAQHAACVHSLPSAAAADVRAYVDAMRAARNAVLACTMFAWHRPASPHLCVKEEGRAVSDNAIVAQLSDVLVACAQHKACDLAVVETAGGVASPAPSGSLQCDVLRPLRMPCVLVGDGRLGGISTTIASHELLNARGYDVIAIVVSDEGMDNAAALRNHFGASTIVHSMPRCPPFEHRLSTPPQLHATMRGWLDDTQGLFDTLLSDIMQHHAQRSDSLDSAQQRAQRMLWWPFTQHATVKPEQVTVIDARCGENFHVLRSAPQHGSDAAVAQLTPMYDACASWWTQGVNAELQQQLVRSAAYAAARYGHVMFPENAHEPALQLADKLLRTVGAGWADRVFFSDNGSTAIEVALKMAFRKYAHDRSMCDDVLRSTALHVIGLQDGYHGDTLGAMDAVSASPYNGPRQMPWYQPRGLFLQPPTAGIVKGQWTVTLPSSLLHNNDIATASDTTFDDMDELFSEHRDGSALAEQYRQHVAAAMDAFELQQRNGVDARLAACILEPVMQGAGGMVFVDPLFQRIIVEACRQCNIPVIFDEVFTGLWRLGAMSGAQLLRCEPDIACYAKLLTGGMLPLSATVCRGDVFDAFTSQQKTHALLHGHSYTGHAIGCSVANTALRLLFDANANQNLCTPDRCTRATPCSSPCNRMQPLWQQQLVDRISHHSSVQRVVVLGTVFAAELKVADGGGYASNAAAAVVRRLRQHGIFARPLGNVVYLMVTPTTSPADAQQLLHTLLSVLDSMASAPDNEAPSTSASTMPDHGSDVLEELAA